MSRLSSLRPTADPTITKYFLPSEVIVENTRLHWSVVIEPFLSALGSLFAAGYIVGQLKDRSGSFDEIILLAAVVMILRLVWKVLEWDFDRFIITNRRIALITGLVANRRVAMMPLERVTDMTYSQTIPGRIFGWGTFVVESAGQDQALRVVNRLPSPDILYKTVIALMFAPTARSVPASAEPREGLPGPNSDGS